MKFFGFSEPGIASNPGADQEDSAQKAFLVRLDLNAEMT